MASEEQARHTARELSRVMPTRVWRVYLTFSGDHWVRMDDKPRRRVDNLPIKHISAYLNGEETKA